MPVKKGSKAEQWIAIEVQNDPTLTAAKISGIGTGCSPSSMTIVAAETEKAKKNYSFLVKYIFAHFHEILKIRVNEANMKESEQTDFGKRIVNASMQVLHIAYSLVIWKWIGK